MSQVLITRATGLVSGYLLCMLLNEPRVNAIAAPTRRPLTNTVGIYNPHDPQLTDAPAQVTDPVNIAFRCLGIAWHEAGNKETFIYAGYTLVVDMTPAGHRLDVQHMLAVSSMGTNADSLFFYNRAKGEMEQALIVQNWPRLTIVQSLMLLDGRDKQRTNEVFLAPLFRLLSGGRKLIEAHDVTRTMLAEALALRYEEVSALTSSELRKRAK